MVCLYSPIISKGFSVHNNDATFSKPITGKKFEWLGIMIAENNAESTNAQNELTVVSTRGNLFFIISDCF